LRSWSSSAGLCLNGSWYRLASIGRNISTELSWNLPTLLSGDLVATLLGNSLAFLSGDRLAFLFGLNHRNLNTLLSWDRVTLLGCYCVTFLLGDILTFLLMVRVIGTYFFLDCGAFLFWHIRADDVTDLKTLRLKCNINSRCANLVSRLRALEVGCSDALLFRNGRALRLLVSAADSLTSTAAFYSFHLHRLRTAFNRFCFYADCFRGVSALSCLEVQAHLLPSSTALLLIDGDAQVLVDCLTLLLIARAALFLINGPAALAILGLCLSFSFGLWSRDGFTRYKC